MPVTGLAAAFNPQSIAVIGASDNPHKVGGRPILFMKRYGFRGPIWPVNPGRTEVQGLKAYPDLKALPGVPDLAVVAVSGEEAVRAVEACAAAGVKVAVVMSSGFGEVGGEGTVMQARMLDAARAAGMRMIGPNCQGTANFATGAIANFSTIFHEMEAKDGPVAIVSQSGACSQAIYVLARQRGLDVRHVHATGNEADVTVADLVAEIVRDEGVKLVLLYLEAIPDPAALGAAAEAARARDLPIVAIKAGRTASGARAASSHTGALASEDRVVDAFFRRHGIWRVADPHELVSAGQLYLKGWRPQRARLLAISNSGASCVMTADASEQLEVPLAELSEATRARLRAVIPGFATATNPLDVTGAVLTDGAMFSRVLPVLAEAGEAELVLGAFPIAGAGYDVPRFARDFAAFAQASGAAVAIAAPQAEVRAPFAAEGLPVFEREREAVAALGQLARHAALMRVPPPARATSVEAPALPKGKGAFLNEAQSLALLAAAGLPVIEHRLCKTQGAAREAAMAFGGAVVVKACSSDLPHKSEHGLVKVGLDKAVAVAKEVGRQKAKVRELGARFEGAIVARMAARGHELALGARLDPQFGPVVMIGDGGIYLEALKDFALLLPPFDVAAVMDALAGLRIAPLLAGVRGEAPRDLDAVARMAVRLGDTMLAWNGRVASVDINPVRVGAVGEGALALDALVERAVAPGKAR